MTDELYQGILENNLLKSVEKLGMSNDWICQHDNDPKRRAATVAKWLNRNRVQRLHWPSFSPDLNIGGLRKSNLKPKGVERRSHRSMTRELSYQLLRS